VRSDGIAVGATRQLATCASSPSASTLQTSPECCGMKPRRLPPPEWSSTAASAAWPCVTPVDSTETREADPIHVEASEGVTPLLQCDRLMRRRRTPGRRKARWARRHHRVEGCLSLKPRDASPAALSRLSSSQMRNTVLAFCLCYSPLRYNLLSSSPINPRFGLLISTYVLDCGRHTRRQCHRLQKEHARSSRPRSQRLKPRRQRYRNRSKTMRPYL
jgi:hypothetical protein